MLRTKKEDIERHLIDAIVCAQPAVAGSCRAIPTVKTQTPVTGLPLWSGGFGPVAALR